LEMNLGLRWVRCSLSEVNYPLGAFSPSAVGPALGEALGEALGDALGLALGWSLGDAEGM
jgi:hypothetical protein